jgi:membrane protease YdiL (CAAX protease family)
MKRELHRLGEAHRDPAVTFLMLFPLGLIHLLGRQQASLEAYGLVESAVSWCGTPGQWVLGGLLVASFLWALGRIQQLELAWRGGAALILIEGILWALLLGPVLSQLTEWLPLTSKPLMILQESAAGASGAGSEASAWGSLAIAAGAGLYEELLFRAVALGGLALLLQAVFGRLAEEVSARRLAWFIALLLSSLAFALAHAIPGDPEALEAKVLAFRTLAGLSFGLLFIFRGLAVAAYAHAAYDALYLLT